MSDNSLKSLVIPVSIVLVLAGALLVNLDMKNFLKEGRVIERDIHHYYGYLPSYFIYEDLKVDKSSYQASETESWFWQVKLEGGKQVFKMTYGLAILYAPFYFVAHQTAELTGYPENGFSAPYKFFLILGTLFYLYLGLYFTARILRKSGIREEIIALTILLLGLGTNLFAYATQQSPMPHVYNFALIALFIWFTINWHETKKWSWLIGVALTFALITLIRVSNGIIIVFYLLYGVRQLSDIRKIKISFTELAFLAVCMVIVWLPQILYWKEVSGKYFVYTYGDERFFFNQPKVYRGLFSFRNGWLIYTPLMIFAISGIFMLRDKFSHYRIPILVFLILHIYIVFSWWNWWYGGSIGSRPMVDSYALMAIPLAVCLEYIFSRKMWKRIAFSFIFTFFIWLNIFQTYQYEYGSLDSEGMNQRLYFKQFGKLERIPDFQKYVSPVNAHEAIKGNR